MKVRYRQTFYAVSLLIGDIFMILTALRFSFWLKFQSGLLPARLGMPNYTTYAQAFGLAVILMILAYRNYGLYIESKISSFWDEAGLVLRATSITFLTFLAISFFYRGFSFSRDYMVVAWVTIVGFVLALRMIQGYTYMFYRRSTNKLKEILIVGATQDAVRYHIKHVRRPRRCTKVIGLVDDCHAKGSKYRGLEVLGKLDELESILQENENINEVMITQSDLEHDRIVKVMMICEKYLVGFKWMPDVLALMTAQMRVQYDLGLTLLTVKDSPLLDWENRLLKRLADVVLSGIGILLLSPLFLILAIVIKLDSKGPIFYRQERVGEDGSVFDLYKFRTMKVGAEDKTGPVWAKEDDDRRTRIGGFLRSFNLDEFPQLWNVLVGHMSLVGPRPERPHFVGKFKENIPWYMSRHKIKSGITGWAQVNGLRGDTSIEKRTKYDLYYIENWSILFDIKILLKTIFAFKNAY